MLAFVDQHEPVVLADVVRYVPVMEGQATDTGAPLKHHCAHLMVNGALHAQGWDHARAAEARRMEAKEATVLAGLGGAGPYRHR